MHAKPRHLAVIMVCLAIAFFAVAYPVYVIHPFRSQGARELQVALFLIRYRGGVELAAALTALIAGLGHWRAHRGVWRKLGSAALTFGVLVCAALSRVNLYEKLFHPIANPSFTAAGESKLDGDEKVIAIAVGGAARAYPVRIISYHHIVNDFLGGVPVAATY